ncbi:unnamed protein product [Schistosoma margrebowiei]|uniref:Uncharacterized protein n=1 Tax=Schistosoma margrebowiei TaxID=48269 RepID=A0A183MXL5_9TREM|nr:unnamed protein product [Schistosoma margrebowiei]
MCTQRYADNSLKICDTVHEDEIKFRKCLSCGKFHSRNSCAFSNAKCFKCGKIEHIRSVCHTTVHSAATNLKICSCDSIDLGVSNDHLSLSTTSKSSIESHSRPELNETQNPYMDFPNDSYISDEIPYKSEENMLNEPSHDWKPDAVLIDADFLFDSPR